MNKRWRNVGLYVLAVITVIFIGTSVFDKPNPENSSLVKKVFTTDETGKKIFTYATVEKPISIFLNNS